MGKRARFFRRIGAAVLLAAVVLTASVPVLAGDLRPGGRRVADAVDSSDVISALGVEWSRLPAVDPAGVEWT